MNNLKIGIIGLGYVGLPLAVEFSKKYKVYGYDKDHSRISELIQGNDRTLEVTKESLESLNNLSFTSDPKELYPCEIYIITVPTPIDGANRPDLTPLKSASAMVGKLLQKGDIVIYESTVFPGATEEVCVPILSNESGLIFNKDFFCGYSPERINPGDKINTLTTIKKITSGSDLTTAETVDNLYGSVIKAGTYKAESIKVAEAAKVIENAQRDLNIAFVNELSLIFERLGIDTLQVLEAASTKWNFLNFKPGLVGGHCIGVDPYYLTHKAEEVGYNPQVILAGRRINDNMGKYAARSVIKRMVQNKIDVTKSVVTILGVTFKENCPDTRNSKVENIVNELEAWGISVKVFDPWVNLKDLKNIYGNRVIDKLECNVSHSIIVAVPHDDFKRIQIKELRNHCMEEIKPVFADIKGAFKPVDISKHGFTPFRF